MGSTKNVENKIWALEKACAASVHTTNGPFLICQKVWLTETLTLILISFVKGKVGLYLKIDDIVQVKALEPTV